MADEDLREEVSGIKSKVHQLSDEVDEVRRRLVILEQNRDQSPPRLAVSVDQPAPEAPPPLEVQVLKREKELPSAPAKTAVPPTVRATVTAEFNGPAGEDETAHAPLLAAAGTNRAHVTAETTAETRTTTATGDDGVTITKKLFVSEHVITTTANAPKMPSPYQNGTTPMKVIGLQKRPNDDHLGLTVRQDNGQLVIARIHDDSPLAKQGLVHVGDSIIEVNGVEVNTPEELQQVLNNTESVSLKIVPSALEVAPPVNGVYVRCHFDYDAKQDGEIPSKDIGLSFRMGEILQVISKDDQHWWQARKVTDWAKTGLVPSQMFQEKRTGVKGAKSNLDQQDLSIYEEVGRLTPYGRRVLVLVGAPGVGRRTLKAKLLSHDANNFGTITPYTTRKIRDGEIDGREYNFVPRSKMQQEIDRGEFLEWGEFNTNFYGTKLDSVRKIMRSGRLCVLDCSPQALKLLYNHEFMPYVVFLAPPPFEEFQQLYQVHPNRTKPKTDEDLRATCEESARLESAYKQYFDLVLVNRNAEVTFRRLLDALEALKTSHQWVPISWIYG